MVRDTKEIITVFYIFDLSKYKIELIFLRIIDSWLVSGNSYYIWMAPLPLLSPLYRRTQGGKYPLSTSRLGKKLRYKNSGRGTVSSSWRASNKRLMRGTSTAVSTGTILRKMMTWVLSYCRLNKRQLTEGISLGLCYNVVLW